MSIRDRAMAQVALLPPLKQTQITFITDWVSGRNRAMCSTVNANVEMRSAVHIDVDKDLSC